MPTTTAPVRPSTTLKPFTVEFGDENCRNFLISALRLKVRGEWSIQTLSARPGGPGDPGQLAGMPAIPGQRMELDPRKLTYRIFDPLEGDETKLKRITEVARKSFLKSRLKGGDYKPTPEAKAKLDKDKFKTLLIEIGKMVHPLSEDEADVKAKLVQGDFPTAKQIDEMEGDELYDPNNNSSQKPRYKRDSQRYLDELDGRR